MKITKSMMQTAQIEVVLSYENVMDILHSAIKDEMKRSNLPGTDWKITGSTMCFTIPDDDDDDDIRLAACTATYNLTYVGKP